MNDKVLELEPFDPVPLISEEISVAPASIKAVLSLFAEGCTVPFIARYRKEATGNLDEVQIRKIEERNAYLIELDKRRLAIIESIESQGKMTPELRALLLACSTKAALEDLYLPYKPKRRTRATIAREKGLEPLALRILEQPEKGDPIEEAKGFINAEKGVQSEEEALKGAMDIVAEIVSENAEVRKYLRETFMKKGIVSSEAKEGIGAEPTKYEQYYDFTGEVATIPSHRLLAILRGEREEILKVKIAIEEEETISDILKIMGRKSSSPFAANLEEAAADGYSRLLEPSIETDIRVELKARADLDAIEVFANNLGNILMAPPLGPKSVIGIDPGIRTGCKIVAVDKTGKFLDNATIYLARGGEAEERAHKEFIAFVKKHNPVCVAIGNGTYSRETEEFVRTALQREKLDHIMAVSVNEAGASVYSASEIAREEFPELDLTVRGAISIARRLQDPLAELVKIDPKSIGVGQYQHDVNQFLLQKKLEDVVESCVNRVGVELNTASAPLLSRVSGLGPSVSKRIVKYREEKGEFSNRMQLLKVPGLGAKTFEQAAGFLRILGGENPLDASAVHPERYELVEKIARDKGLPVENLVGDAEAANSINIAAYIGEGVGEPTLRDIIEELKKPGRDPRSNFEPPKFRKDVQTISDIKPGMEFEGVVTNVTNFGAFVDIGVHQDGLVHISQLADKFVKDPHEVVKAGDRIKVWALEVDEARKRIALTARTGGAKTAEGDRNRRAGDKREDKHKGRERNEENSKTREKETGFRNNPFADLLSKK